MKLGRSSGSPGGYFDDAIPCKWHDVIRNFCFHNTIKNLLINTSVADVEEYPSNSPLYSKTCSQMFPSFVHDNFGHAVNFLPRILLSVSHIFHPWKKHASLLWQWSAWYNNQVFCNSNFWYFCIRTEIN